MKILKSKCPFEENIELCKIIKIMCQMFYYNEQKLVTMHRILEEWLDDR